jgi:tetratricopeptide (TPR) repeat protein
MRIVLAVGWLIVPVLAWAWHAGPGQQYVKLDEANVFVSKAQEALAKKDYARAVEEFDAALKSLPEGRVAESRRIRLERDKAMMFAKKLPEAHEDLDNLVAELQADPKADPRLLADARAALANSQYYVTWLMRLRGHARDEWEPEIEGARQTYRMLAEQAEAAGDQNLMAQFQQDCESAIRLARMDLDELQGLPLPSQ